MSTQIPAQPEPPFEPPHEIDPQIGSLGIPGVPTATAAPRQPRHQRPPEPVSLSHHAPRCSICNHPEREAIEQAFLHWERPTAIAYEYNLGHRRAVYRHAHALGLFQKRAWRTRRSLEFIMEQAETVKATADSVIRAVKAHACLGEDGRWHEPEKRIVVIHQVASAEAAPTRARVPIARLAPADPTRIGIPSEALRREGPRTRNSPLATAVGIDGYTCRTKNAATPSPSTKLRKLMDTLAPAPGAERTAVAGLRSG